MIAGAGSGKTRVLTFKIAYLLEHDYDPWQVLALTFTNKAAREMNERIAQIVGPGRSRGLWSGTFHSIFARILRAESTTIGLESNFSIYDSSESRSLIKSIVKEMGLDDKTYKPSRVAGRISRSQKTVLSSRKNTPPTPKRSNATAATTSVRCIASTPNTSVAAAPPKPSTSTICSSTPICFRSCRGNPSSLRRALSLHLGR